MGYSTIYSKQLGPIMHYATVPVMLSYDIPFVLEDGKVKPVVIELVPHCSDSFSTKDDVFNVTIFS